LHQIDFTLLTADWYSFGLNLNKTFGVGCCVSYTMVNNTTKKTIHLLEPEKLIGTVLV